MGERAKSMGLGAMRCIRRKPGQLVAGATAGLNLITDAADFWVRDYCENQVCVKYKAGVILSLSRTRVATSHHAFRVSFVSLCVTSARPRLMTHLQRPPSRPVGG